MDRVLEAVIFDMDGLIIDTEKTYKDGWLLGAKELAIDLPADFIADAAGRSIANNTQALLEITGDPEMVRAIRKVREDLFFTRLEAGEIPLKPHFRELIQTLKKHGIKTAVATSSYKKRVEQMFVQYQMEGLFDVVLTGDEVKNVKPDPEIYLTTLELLGVSRENALVLEDSITGASAANNAQIPFIIVPDSSSEKTVVIPDNFTYMATTVSTLADVEIWLYQKGLLNEKR